MTSFPLEPQDDSPEGWSLLIRGDHRIEVLCTHGIGHTSKVLTLAKGFIKVERYYGVHGCDGCCGKPQFMEMEDYGLQRLQNSYDATDRGNVVKYLKDQEGQD